VQLAPSRFNTRTVSHHTRTDWGNDKNWENVWSWFRIEMMEITEFLHFNSLYACDPRFSFKSPCECVHILLYSRPHVIRYTSSSSERFEWEFSTHLNNTTITNNNNGTRHNNIIPLTLKYMSWRITERTRSSSSSAKQIVHNIIIIIIIIYSRDILIIAYMVKTVLSTQLIISHAPLQFSIYYYLYNILYIIIFARYQPTCFEVFDLRRGWTPRMTDPQAFDLNQI